MAMLAAVSLLVLGAWVHVPLWTWAIWMPAAGALAWSLRQPSANGTQIADHRLIWHCGRNSGEVDIASIAYAEFRQPRDGSGECALVLRDGSTVRVPQRCLPDLDVLAAALQADGVTIRRA